MHNSLLTTVRLEERYPCKNRRAAVVGEVHPLFVKEVWCSSGVQEPAACIQILTLCLCVPSFYTLINGDDNVCASESSCEYQIHIINVKYLVLNKCWLLIRLCVVDLALSKSDWGTKVLTEGSQIRFEGNQEEGNN